MGVLASVLATLVGAPLDVVKTRVQASQTPAISIRSAIRDIIVKEGAGTLWKGAGVKTVKVTIGTFLAMSLYEVLYCSMT